MWLRLERDTALAEECFYVFYVCLSLCMYSTCLLFVLLPVPVLMCSNSLCVFGMSLHIVFICRPR